MSNDSRFEEDKFIFPFDEIVKVQRIYRSSDYTILAIWEEGQSHWPDGVPRWGGTWTHEFDVNLRALRL